MQKRTRVIVTICLGLTSILGLALLSQLRPPESRKHDSGNFEEIVTHLKMHSIRSSIIEFRRNHGYPPAQDVVSDDLRSESVDKISTPSQSKASAANEKQLDAWKTPIEIRIDGDTVAMRSAGPDRVFGNEDDLLMNSRFFKADDRDMIHDAGRNGVFGDHDDTVAEESTFLVGGSRQ
jgi:hypothetical protein